MNLRSTGTLSFFGLLGIMACAGAANAQLLVNPPNLVINGSFEIGADPGLTTQINAPNSTAIPGWTVSNGDLDYIANRWVAADGVRTLDMSGYHAGTLYQDVTGLTVGGLYRLSFQMAGNPESGPVIKDMRVTLGASYFQDYAFDGTGRTPTNMGWIERGFEFVANDSTMRLTFISLEYGC